MKWKQSGGSFWCSFCSTEHEIKPACGASALLPVSSQEDFEGDEFKSARLHICGLFSRQIPLLPVQMRVRSEGAPARSARVVPTGSRPGGLIGIPAASGDPDALCWVREIKAAHIRGISDRRCSDRSPQVAALIREYRTWARRRRGELFQPDQTLHLSILI